MYEFKKGINMWLSYLINFLLFNSIFCLPSLPELENGLVLQRLTKLYTLRSKAKLSELCEKQSKIYYNALTKGTPWALEMMDASSKLQAGLAGWNLADLGSFDQCLAIDSNENNIKGKFCYTRLEMKSKQVFSPKMLEWQNQREYILRSVPVTVRPKDMMSGMMGLRWSFCIPDGCSASDAQAHLNNFFLNNENASLFNVQEGDCQTLESQPELTTGDWTAIGFIIALCCIIITSTAYDVFVYYTGKESLHPLLTAFSWYTNFKKFIKVNNNPDQLPCLNGIRFISMLWIIHGHQVASSLIRVVVNLKDAINWTQTFWAMATIGSSVSVDTFFLLSGCLLMYGFLKTKSKNAPFNIPFMYLHRYLRLTPMYVAMLIFCITLYVHFSSGPTWFTFIRIETDNCNEYWWSTLLYIQNFVNPNNFCIGQGWYLQIDMQLFVISPLILIPVYKYPRYVPYIFSILIILFTFIPIGIAWYYNFGIIESEQKQDLYYANTFARAGPWFIGLALGYALFYSKRRKYQLTKTSNAILWIVSLFVLFWVVFGNYEAQKQNYYNDPVYAILFIGLHRNIWSIFIGLIIFACVNGYGGPVNWFLSLPMFQVLSRLTYSMYLTHLMLLQITGPKRTPIYFSNLDMLLSFFGTLGVCLIISLVCLLTFETPFATIDNVLVGGLSNLMSKKKIGNLSHKK